MSIAGNRPNDQSVPPRALDLAAADALARAADLWEQRLAEGWTPPEGSEFPLAMVRLSLAALLPGMREWVRSPSILAILRPSASLTPPPPLSQAKEGEFDLLRHSLVEEDADLTNSPSFACERGGGGVREREPEISTAEACKQIALILAGNTPLLAWSPLAACLLAGHTVWVKMSQGETLWPRLFRDALAQVAPDIAERIRLDVWPGDDPRTAALIASTDAVIAYGSDATITTLRALTPTEKPFFGYGYGVSVGVIQNGLFYSRHFSYDILMYGQAGCLSPQAIFVKSIGRSDDRFDIGKMLRTSFKLSLNFRVEEFGIPPVADPAIAHRIRAARDLAHFSGAIVTGDRYLRWTIIQYHEPAPLPLPAGYGIITIMPIVDVVRDFGPMLGALRGHLSSAGVGIQITEEERAAIRAEGVSRICLPGEMQTPPLDWPNGNIDLLAELLRL